MPPLQIIKTVDIVDDACNTLTASFITTIVNPFSFQAAEKPLRNSIIQAITFATHTACNTPFIGVWRWYIAPLDHYGTLKTPFGHRLFTANLKARIVKALSGLSESAQLTIFLEHKSITIARYNQP